MARQAESCLKSIVHGTLSTSPATQQVRRAETVPTHLSYCRPGEQRCARVRILAGSGSGPEGAYLNTQDPVVKLYYRMHEGTRLRFLQSGSIGAAKCPANPGVSPRFVCVWLFQMFSPVLVFTRDGDSTPARAFLTIAAVPPGGGLFPQERCSAPIQLISQSQL